MSEKTRAVVYESMLRPLNKKPKLDLSLFSQHHRQLNLTRRLIF